MADQQIEQRENDMDSKGENPHSLDEGAEAPFVRTGCQTQVACAESSFVASDDQHVEWFTGVRQLSGISTNCLTLRSRCLPF